MPGAGSREEEWGSSGRGPVRWEPGGRVKKVEESLCTE